MTTARARARALVVLAVNLACVAALADGAQAAAPVKLILTSHLGRQVDLTQTNLKAGPALEDVCPVASKDQCQEGSSSSDPAGYLIPLGVAGSSTGNVYVVDIAANRVQELTGTGEFVLVFGRGVNATTGGDICTAEEVKAKGVKCQAGTAAASAGALSEPTGTAVDPQSGNVYVQDRGNQRIEEYAPGGAFLLMIGKEVNQTRDIAPGSSEAEKNLCTAVSKDTCKTGVQAAPGSTERGAFFFEGHEPLIAVGAGAEPRLYVGSGARVQEFSEGGEWKGEIDVPAAVATGGLEAEITALAVARMTGVVYLVYKHGAIHEYDPTSGSELGTGTSIAAVEAGQPVSIRALAADPAGHLAVWAYEGQGSFEERERGYLLEASDGHVLTRFQTPEFVRTDVPRAQNSLGGIGFNGKGEFYASFETKPEVWSYVPESVGELVTGGTACAPDNAAQAASTFHCGLSGEVNPFGVLNTQAWFEWAKSEGAACTPGSEVGRQAVASGSVLVPVAGQLQGLRPNQGFCYRLAGSDEHAEPPEKLAGVVKLGKTPAAPPKAIGAPGASFITASSALFSGELDPENANTEYFIEYAAGARTLAELCPNGVLQESCPGVASTAASESEAYAQIGATFETRSLQPSTLYHYRLAAKNEAAAVLGGEGTPFQTPAAATVQAQTGGVSEVTATSAVIGGSVNPDGQRATYAFELGVDRGAETQFGTVAVTGTGTATSFEPESVALTGLQPGTTYAYRIAIHSGYGTAVGSAATFTTPGLPSQLQAPAVLAMLATPNVAFPPPAVPGKPKKPAAHGCVPKSARRSASAMKGRASARGITRRPPACIRRIRKHVGKRRH